MNQHFEEQKEKLLKDIDITIKQERQRKIELIAQLEMQRQENDIQASAYIHSLKQIKRM